MRITGGVWAGRRLQLPKGPHIRPTQDQVRQALFNLLGETIQGARILDLFCGSGALGLEALSRGASHVTFVDRSPFCIRAVGSNLEGLSPVTGSTTLRRSDAIQAIRRLHRAGEQFDLIFLDPPYGGNLARKTLIALSRYVIVSTAGWVIVEHDKRDPLSEEWSGEENRLISQRIERYGDTALTLYRRQ